MTITTHTRSQPSQANLDTYVVPIVIYNRCSVTMSYSKQDFVVTLLKVRRVINIFEDQKVHTIYEGASLGKFMTIPVILIRF